VGGSAGNGGTAGQGGSAAPGGSAGQGGSAAQGGSAGQGGSSGPGGASGKAGTAGTSGTAGTGAGGSGGNPSCVAPSDQCPGTEIKLTGTGAEPRVGHIDGTTLGKCSDYEGSCSQVGAPDTVHWFKTDVDGSMSIGGGSSGPIWVMTTYARSVCNDPATELICTQDPPSTPIPISANTVYYVIVEGPISSTLGDYTLAVKVIPN
jgi:hypothetical protein